MRALLRALFRGVGPFRSPGEPNTTASEILPSGRLQINLRFMPQFKKMVPSIMRGRYILTSYSHLRLLGSLGSPRNDRDRRLRFRDFGFRGWWLEAARKLI